MESETQRARRFRIVVRGRLSQRLGTAFDDVRLERRAGQTVLSGAAGQADLDSVLARLTDLGIEPLSVEDLTSETLLIESLKARDEHTFATLVDEYSSSLLRVARAHVSSRAVAEEVVQETWLAVIKGLDRFEGRSSLKTWIFSILTNTAKSRGQRERRNVPFSSLNGSDPERGTEVVDADRFFPPDHSRYPGHWSLGPTAWQTPEEGLVSSETRKVILDAIDELPTAQRMVVTLRDVEGWPAEEICEVLDVSDGNQSVLLHRGRAKVRSALERYFGAVEETV